MIRKLMCGAAALVFGFQSVSAQNLADPAAAFGARESIESIALSPDGRHVLYVEPSRGQGSILYTVDLADNNARRATQADGINQRLGGCNFISDARMACTIWVMTRFEGILLPVSRLVAINGDGSNIRMLGERDTARQYGIRGSSGNIIDFGSGGDTVLMGQSYVPEADTRSRIVRRQEGYGVVRLDTATLASAPVEAPREDAVRYISDGRGNIRIMGTQATTDTGDSPTIVYYYRQANSRDWVEFGRVDTRLNGGLRPVAVDPTLNVAYAFDTHEGRTALFRISLDGSLRRELVASHPQVDVDGLIRIGRRARVVGASFATDRRQAVYFDPDLQRLSQQLHNALPNLPQIRFVDSSEDERRLLIWAGSDTDPGRYFVYDKSNSSLNELMLARPQLENVPLARVRSMTFRAGDGTDIPGYLTLPPGRTDARGLPGIVMPHGGPSARDEWGFDWLAQYFANRGYAVLQPNFRGSSGYGDAWFRTNGFVSWRTAIGDVSDAGRWLLAQGVAPERLAIFGWSYGGYAALQAQVLDPGLFRAAVAVAPVTDLDVARNEWRDFTNAALVRDFFGQGPHIREGSPAQNAAAFRAPVLMFHGDLDRNVGIRQARLMDERLHAAGKRSELIVYPGLDHQLEDSTARADMLRRSDAFLRQALGLPAQP